MPSGGICEGLLGLTFLPLRVAAADGIQGWLGVGTGSSLHALL